MTRPDDDLISIIAHGIADAQGDAYAEYASEFDGYAKAALFALKKNLCGFSTNGVNVWATPDDIKTVMDWQQSHSVVDDLRTHVRRWREGYGKLEGSHREMLDLLKRAIAVWDAEVFDEAAADAVLKSAVETVARMEPRT